MALALINPAFKAIKGRIGDLIAVKHSEGQIILRKAPRITKEPTSNQLAHRERVKKAVAYAKAAIKDDAKAPLYRAAAKESGRRAFNIAFKDYFNPPEVLSIDLGAFTGKSGQTITVRAQDDFAVARVDVRIEDADRKLIEEGSAVQEKGAWTYRTRTEVPPEKRITVVATAEDYPGNTGTLTQPWISGLA